MVGGVIEFGHEPTITGPGRHWPCFRLLLLKLEAQ
jgi:hypothetical protein